MIFEIQKYQKRGNGNGKLSVSLSRHNTTVYEDDNICQYFYPVQVFYNWFLSVCKTTSIHLNVTPPPHMVMVQ